MNNKLIAEILHLRDQGRGEAGNFDYGAEVMPVLRHYAALRDYEARREFQRALEEMLASKDETLRSYAVTVCLGFFVFRDAI